jgi:hypothetical protein
MKTLGIAVALLILAACGSTSNPAAQQSPSTASSPNAQVLVVLLQAKGTADQFGFNTISLVGIDGRVRASTSFTPAPRANLGCIGAVSPAPAHVAAGKAFFADGSGALRSLAPDGTVTAVTTFPITSAQQMLSFAVSPDGTQVVGGIFAAPKNAFTCDGSTPAGSYSFDAYRAGAGTSPQLVYHQSWSQPPPAVMAFTGWDTIGPIGTYPTVYASQGGGPASTLGGMARIDPTTLMATPLTDPSSCLVWDSNASGAFVCTASAQTGAAGTNSPVQTAVSVRQPDGQKSWDFTVSDENAASSPFLSPDGQHVVVCCSLAASAEFVFAKDGTHAMLAGGFFAGGWLDSNTVYGWTDATTDNPQGNASYVRIDAPGTAVKLGVSGRFVGPISI